VPRYFLTRIKIEGFRGINNEGDPLELKFRPDAVNSVFAINGIGKSSIYEALSFAIRGYIPKLEELQAHELTHDYYSNRFHSARQATIDLEFQSDDSSANTVSIHIERDGSGQKTVTSPSGQTDPEAFLESLDEDFSLLDYRTFSRFIDDTPLERGRSFSALLGLSAYSDFRQSLQALSDTRALNSDLDIRVIEASIRTSQSASQQALANVRSNYEKVTGKSFEDVDKIAEYMGEVVSALAGVELLKTHFEGKYLQDVDFEEVKTTIRTEEGGDKRKQLETVIEAISTLKALGEAQVDVYQTEQQALLALLTERDELLATTQGDLVKRLYEAAERAVEGGSWKNDQECMLCNSDLDFSISEHIRSQLAQYDGVADKLSEIKKLCLDSTWITRLSALEGSVPLGVSEDDLVSQYIAVKVQSGRVTAEELNATTDRLVELEKLLANKIGELEEYKLALEKELPASLVQLTEHVESARQCMIYAEKHQAAQSEEFAYSQQLGIRERWKSFINRATLVFAEAEANLSKSKIAAIDSGYKDMFKRIMNVGDVVPDLQRADNREDLNVQLSDFHGQHSLSARALLSESYRNALAISVFLAAALKHTGAPRFVVLDDVTSSFDAGHQYFLMELIRGSLQYPSNPDGLQFIVLSHDALLEKYFDRHGGTGNWRHHRLQGAPPMGQVLSQSQDANRLRTNIQNLLSAGQVTQAEHLIRQYLEYKLQQIIRKVNVPVPIDFAIKDQARMVSNCLGAIKAAVDLHDNAGSLVLDTQQVQDLDTVHVPALIGNWVSHYETGTGGSLSAPVLLGVVQTIDDLAECFRFDDNSTGTVVRRWYKSLSSRT
jgi:recombinational DNA repair ATPase RecF